VMKRRNFLTDTVIGISVYASVYCPQTHAAGTSISAQPLIKPPELQPFPPLSFPRDHGAHKEFRTEWWYMTGTLQSEAQQAFGFQITFFRSRVDLTQSSTSRFAAKQLIFAHAALTDVKAGVLLHDDRISREGFGIAAASDADTDVQIRDWFISRVRRNSNTNENAYSTRVASKDFTLDLTATPTQPLLLQGKGGYSRKGPDSAQASYYYSQPQLAISGSLLLQGKQQKVQGTAWLDHEWSEAILHPEAVGWDWIGMNLDDGAALTAFQLRRKDGTALWSGGSYRAKNGATRTFNETEVRFEAQAFWTSPASKARYPTRWKVYTPAGNYTVASVIPNQELDSRKSTGTIYWEGVSDLLNESGQRVGRGYLEMTGYAGVLRL
jgi:predicted secreted hydrolase